MNWLILGGVFYFSWVVPVGIAVAILGVAYLGFLSHLPSRARTQFAMAGAIDVPGGSGH